MTLPVKPGLSADDPAVRRVVNTMTKLTIDDLFESMDVRETVLKRGRRNYTRRYVVTVTLLDRSVYTERFQLTSRAVERAFGAKLGRVVDDEVKSFLKKASSNGPAIGAAAVPAPVKARRRVDPAAGGTSAASSLALWLRVEGAWLRLSVNGFVCGVAN